MNKHESVLFVIIREDCAFPIYTYIQLIVMLC